MINFITGSSFSYDLSVHCFNHFVICDSETFWICRFLKFVLFDLYILAWVAGVLIGKSDGR
jgi:uncharacterized membrane protein